MNDFPIDVNTLAQFPLVAMFAWALFKLLTMHREERTDIMDRHERMNDKLSEGLDRNTDTLTNLDKTIQQVRQDEQRRN